MATVGETYTQDKYSQKVQQARSQVGDNPAAIAQSIGDKMIAQDQPLQEATAGQSQNIQGMQELAAYDQAKAQEVKQANIKQAQIDEARRQATTQMGAAGATPQQTIAMGPAQFDIDAFTKQYAPVKELISPFVASGLTSGQQQAFGGEFDLASQARGSRERILGSEIAMIADLARSQIEQEGLKQAQDQQNFDNAMAVAELTGATTFTDPNTGEVYDITPESKMTATEQDVVRIKEEAVADIAGHMTPRDLFAKYRDAVDFNELIGLYNQNSPFGPAKETMEELRAMYEGAEEEIVGYEDKLAGVKTASERTSISDYTSFLQRAKQISGSLGEQAKGGFLDVFGATTGPIAGRLGWRGNEEQEKIKSDLGVFSDEIRKGLFGSAVTEIEIKQGTIPDKKKQETENLKMVDSMISKKETELRNRLSMAGFTPEEINAYMQDMGISGSEQQMTTMQSPDGETYQVDESEAAEAEANGWKRI